MSQGFYFEESSYRLIEQLLFITQDLSSKIELLTQQMVGSSSVDPTNSNNSAVIRAELTRMHSMGELAYNNLSIDKVAMRLDSVIKDSQTEGKPNE